MAINIDEKDAIVAKIDNNKVEYVIPFEDLVVFSEENEEQAYIGRTKINRFILVPKIAGEIVEYIKDGMTIDGISSILIENNIEVDLNDFLKNLVELNFIKNVDDYEIQSENIENKSGITFEFIKPKHVKWIFTLPFGIIYLTFVSIGLYLLLSGKTGSAIPTISEAFWHESLLVIVLTLIILDIIFTSTHELFHFFFY